MLGAACLSLWSESTGCKGNPAALNIADMDHDRDAVREDSRAMMFGVLGST